MKLKLSDLHVQSFITSVEKEQQDNMKGGAEVTTGIATRDCTIPINVCNTIGDIHCNLSIERCSNGITRCC